jgi:hypothetical protein
MLATWLALATAKPIIAAAISRSMASAPDEGSVADLPSGDPTLWDRLRPQGMRRIPKSPGPRPPDWSATQPLASAEGVTGFPVLR